MGEFHRLVDLIDREITPQIGEAHRPAGDGVGERPGAVGVAAEVLDARLVLVDQEVVLERREALVGTPDRKQPPAGGLRTGS